MPAASSSRNRRRRAPSSDAIEEDRPSQNHGDEDLNDAEAEAPVAKPSRSTKKRTQPEPQANEDGDDVFPDILANFQDQPLGRAELRGVGGVSEDWGMVRRQVHAMFFNLMNDVGANLAEFAEGEKGEKVCAHNAANYRGLLAIWKGPCRG